MYGREGFQEYLQNEAAPSSGHTAHVHIGLFLGYVGLFPGS